MTRQLYDQHTNTPAHTECKGFPEWKINTEVFSAPWQVFPGNNGDWKHTDSRCGSVQISYGSHTTKSYFLLYNSLRAKPRTLMISTYMATFHNVQFQTTFATLFLWKAGHWKALTKVKVKDFGCLKVKGFQLKMAGSGRRGRKRKKDVKEVKERALPCGTGLVSGCFVSYKKYENRWFSCCSIWRVK